MWSAYGFALYYIWLFRKRHLLSTLIEIIGPSFIIMLLTATSYLEYNKLEIKTREALLTEDDLIKSIRSLSCPSGQQLYVTYYSEVKGSFASSMISEMENMYFGQSNLKFLRVNSEKDITKFAIIHHALKRASCFVGGIVFRNDPLASSASSKSLKVKLKLAHLIPDEIGSAIKRSVYFDPMNHPRDYEPFLGFQVALVRTFYKLASGGGSNKTKDDCESAKFLVQPFPLRGVYRYEYKTSEVHPIPTIIAAAIVLGQTFMVLSLVRGPALDKQTGFRTYLRLLGLSRRTYWTTWWSNEFFVRLIVCALQTVVLFSNFAQNQFRLIQRGNFYIWFLVLVTYNMASISFFIFLASFNKRGLIATYLSVTIWLLSFYVGDLFIVSDYYNSSWRPGVLLMCLNPNSALILACIHMTSTVEGVQWYSVSQYSKQQMVTLLEIIFMLLGDSLLYFVLALYGDIFRPERYSAKFWQHCCTSMRVHASDWAGRQKSYVERVLYGDTADSISSEIMPCYDIVFSNVTFGFERRVKILEDVSIQITDRKRTAIVGPIGAGKTTLARLICGVFPPNSGTVKVAGYDAVIQRSLLRGILSICPSQNLLCDYITLFEHLKLIGRLRGYRVSRASRKARKMLEALELTEYSNEFPSNLVGIQKRKLCVALALIGNPKIIVFDDPTDGIDLESTLNLLKFISTYCEGKTSVLLTQNLSQAYYFGEKIAILTNTRILGSGTKEQLETCLKTGYHLQLTFAPHVDAESVQLFVEKHINNVQKLEKQSTRIQAALQLVENELYEGFVSQETKTSLSQPRVSHDFPEGSRSRSRAVTLGDFHLPDFDGRDTSAVNTLTLVLPRSEAPKFQKFFQLLESEIMRRERGIIDFKLLPYTIDVAYDEVENYMRLHEAKEDIEMKDNMQGNMEDLLAKHHAERLHWKTCQRLKALIVKRVAYLFSVWLHTLSQFFVPLLLLIVIEDSTHHSFGTRLEAAQVEDSLSHYVNPVVLVKRTDSVSNPWIEHFYSHYKNLAGSNQVKEVESFQKTLKEAQKYSEEDLASKYVVGLELKSDQVVAVYSPVAFHSGPISLSLVLNAYLQCVKAHLSATFDGQAIMSKTEEILKFYIPLRQSPDTRPAMMYALVFVFGFFIYTSRFICQPLSERIILLKNLQLNTGLNAFTYWFSYFLCDVVYTSVVIAVGYGTSMALPPNKAFHSLMLELTAITFVFIAGISSILQSYAFSFIFTQPNTSFFAMLSYNQVAGIFLFVLNTFITGTAGIVLKFLSRLSQPFNVFSGVHNFLDIGINNSRCDLMHPYVRESICETDWSTYNISDTSKLDLSCCEYFKTNRWNYTKSYFKWDLSVDELHESPLLDIIFNLVHCVIAIAYISFMEDAWRFRYSRKHSSLSNNASGEQYSQMGDEESVFAIAKKPRASMRNRRHLYVLSLTKRFLFGSEILTGISFYAAPGDLLGIVGPSHSGKTVLMRILTGNLKASRGIIQFKLPSGIKRVNYLKYMGFTPSDDIVNAFPNMKGITLLKVFARLRGIPDSQLKAHVNKWTTLLGLQRQLNQQCEHYTTAVRSKLALALALVGDPPILVLDEPFRDLDPFFTTQFWTIMDYLRKETSRIIIIATSNIQEVASKCTRILILVNGTVHGYMTPEELIQTYGGGFLITFKLKEGTTFKSVTALKSNVKTKFHRCKLLDESLNMLEYRVLPSAKSKSEGNIQDDQNEADKEKPQPILWSQVFGSCQELYQDFSAFVAEYTVSEETWQDIYNRFASKQFPYKQPVGSREEFCTKYC